MTAPSLLSISKRPAIRWLLLGAMAGPLCMLILSYLASDPALRILLVLVPAAFAGGVIARFLYVAKSGKSLLQKTGLAVASVFAVALVLLAVVWKAQSDKGGQVPQEPFCIAGNLYYVGTQNVTSFLLTGPKGHVLIDGGYPGTAGMIEKNIGTLGFNIKDVKILLNSHGHLDHAGGLAALQKNSGAELWVSEEEAPMIASGGAGDRETGLMNFLVFTGLGKYPAPRIDHKYKDGDTVRLGPIKLTAHLTPGHTPGCTSWSFPVWQGNRELLAVDVGSLTLLPVSLLGQPYDAQLQKEFEQSFQTLRRLPADIFLGSHAGFFDMRRKWQERDTAARGVNPFIDSKGYLRYIDDAEKRLREALKEQQQ